MTIEQVHNNDAVYQLIKKYDVHVNAGGRDDDALFFYIQFAEGIERNDIAKAMIAKDKHRVTRIELWNNASEDQDHSECSSSYVVTSSMPNDKNATVETIEERMKVMGAIHDEWESLHKQTVKRRQEYWEKHKDDWP
jgi:hypothetical protein